MGALVYRVQASNYIRNKHSDSWSPRFRDEVYEFEGLSSVVQAPNGVGKTMLSNAFNALLSRRKNLLKKTRGAMAPANSNSYSHFRIEFVSPPSSTPLMGLINAPVVGEKHVFGMCGTRGENSMTFYHYAGTLEDLPVCEKNEDGQIVLFSQKRFDTLLGNFPGTIHKNQKVRDWKSSVAQKIPLHIVDRMARFQEAGGGESESNSIFQLKAGKERFDQAFFWEILAPEIMNNPMGAFAEEDEFHFEDTILRTASGAVAAQIEAEKEMTAIKAQKVATERLDEITQLGERILDSQKKLGRFLTNLSEAMGAVRHTVEDSGLPGFLQYISTGDNQQDSLVKNMVIDPDQGVLLKDRGLAELLGKQAKRVNRKARGEKITLLKSSQAIEIIVDQLFPIDKGGRRASYYSQNTVLRFLDLCEDSYLPAPKEDMLDAINRAFCVVTDKVDTNPFRQRIRRLTSDRSLREENQDEQAGIVDKLEGDVNEIEQSLTEFKENQGLYNEMVKSGLFSQQELSDPTKTQETILIELKEAQKDEQSHQDRLVKVSPVHSTYLKFIKACGEDASPAEKKEKWQNLKASIDEAKQQTEDHYETLKAVVKTAKDEQDEASKAYQPIAAALKELQKDQASGKAFFDKFPEEDPLGFETRTREAIEKAVTTLADASARLDTLNTKVSQLDRWLESHPGVTPQEFIDDFMAARQELQDEKRGIKFQIEEVKKDIVFLSKSKVAPGKDAQKFLSKAHALGDVLTVHEALVSFDLPEERRSKALSLFSSVLFAPVATSMEEVSSILMEYEKERLTLPVFLSDELRSFCAGDEMPVNEIDGVVHTYLAGRRSFTVECILDPKLLEKERVSAEKRLEKLEKAKETIREQLEDKTEENPSLKAAREALETDTNGSRDRLSIQENKVDSLSSQVENSKDTYPEDILVSSRSAEAFSLAGGLSKLREIEAQADSAKRRVKQATTSLETNDKKLTDAEASKNDAHQKELNFLKGNAGVFLKDIDTLVDHLENGDLKFMQGNDELGAAIKQKLVDIGKRLDFRFDRAAAFVSSMDSTEKERQEQLDEKRLELVQAQNDVKETTEKIESIQKREDALALPASRFDDHIASILPAYRSLVELIHDEEMMGLLGDKAYQEPSQDLQGNINMILNSLEDVEFNASDIIVALGSVRSLFEEEYALKQYDDKARSERNTLKQAKDIYIDACIKLMKAPPDGLSLEEVSFMKRIYELPNELSSFVTKKKERVEQDEDDCRKAQEFEDKLLLELTEHLRRLAENSIVGLSELKRVLRRRKEATFQVSVTVNEDLSSVMNKLVYEVKKAQIRLNNEHGVKLFDGSREAERAGRSIRDNLRFELYRSIFQKPEIIVDYPRICGPRKKRYSNEFSSGERFALALLWLTLLAEYSIRIEELNNNTDGHRASNDLGPSVFWIDGLFSNLSCPEILETSLQLKQSLGRFQLIGLMHNPAALFRHDFINIPRLYVTMLRQSIDIATPSEWADSKSFGIGEVDSIMAFLQGSASSTN